MSFSSGTATSLEDLLDKFRIFAETSGYTTNRFAASGAGYVLNLQKAGSYANTLYCNLRSYHNEDPAGQIPQATTGVVVNMSTGYSGAADIMDQPGAPAAMNAATTYYGALIYPVSVVGKYWFFSDTSPEFLAAVIQLPNTEFRHTVFGEIEKTDATVPGGEFFYATNGMNQTNPTAVLPFEPTAGAGQTPSHSYIRLDLDERSGWWMAGAKDTLGTSWSAPGIVFGANYIDQIARKYSKNNFSLMPSLHPFNLYGLRQDGNRSLLGYIPNWRSGRRDGFVVDQEYPLGSDTWMAFPATTVDSLYSLVYKKVV